MYINFEAIFMVVLVVILISLQYTLNKILVLLREIKVAVLSKKDKS